MKENNLTRVIVYTSLSLIIAFVLIGNTFAQGVPRITPSDINTTQVLINTLGWAASFVISILSASFVYYIKTSIILQVNQTNSEIKQLLGTRSLEANQKWNDLASKIADLRHECSKEYLPKEDMKEELANLREELKEMKEDFHRQLDELRGMMDSRKVVQLPPDDTYKRKTD